MKRLRAVTLFGLLALLSFRTDARVFIVTDTTDSTAITSLRGAINAANQLGGHNTIRFGAPAGERKTRASTVYHLTLSGALEDHAQTGDLDIERGTLTIDGQRQNIVIDATGLGDRIFRVHAGARLFLAHLTLTGGRAPHAAESTALENERGTGSGGAIYNAGSLNVKQCVFTNNASGDGAPYSGIPRNNPGDDGGAIYNANRAVLVNCTLTQNQGGTGNDGSEGGQGGGIRNDGNCVLSLCNITGNSSGMGGSTVGSFYGYGGSSGGGGGIYNLGTMLLNKCNVSGNHCPKAADGVTLEGENGSGSFGGYGGNGGGILNAGRLLIEASTISANRAGSGGDSGGGIFGSEGGAGGEGGGILNQGFLTVNNSTISANSTGNGGKGGPGSDFPGNGGQSGNGGGVFNLGTAKFTACTIVLNQTGNGGSGGDATTATNSYGRQTLAGIGGWAGNGGGIYVLIEGVTIRSSLIALNTTGIPGTGGYGSLGADVYGPLSSGGFNLVGSGFNGTNSDIVGTADTPVDPLIGPLKMNGGWTPTHALLDGSPAIDQGKNFNLTRDQRGQRRRVDVPTIPNAIGSDGTDIGAFELNPIGSN